MKPAYKYLSTPVEAIVLVPARCVADVRRVLAECNIQMRIDIVYVPDDEDLGTADALRLVADKINVGLLYTVYLFFIGALKKFSR